MLKKRKKKNPLIRPVLAALGVILILAAVIVALNDHAAFSGVPSQYPVGSSIAGIPVGGLTRQEARKNLELALAIPVELQYAGERMQFLPKDLAIQAASPDALLDSFEKNIQVQSWWSHLWNIPFQAEAIEVPYSLQANQEAIEKLLKDEIAPRYSQIARAPLPVWGTTNFIPGNPGRELSDIPGDANKIAAALNSLTNRVVVLSVRETPTPPLGPKVLEVALKEIIKDRQFDGLVELYLEDLGSGSVYHLAQQNFLDVPPDLAWTGASTVKIPIALSVMRALKGQLTPLAEGWLYAMLTQSLNAPADALVRNILGGERGPLQVTADLRELGYANSFLAGFFEAGAPLLEDIKTAANQRTDINLSPDRYNQTVPSEIGNLMARIARCALDPAQSLFNGDVSQAACQKILSVMSENHIGSLIEAGMPPNVNIAHKHGWTTGTDDYVHSISDIAYIPDGGAGYVEGIFVYSSGQLIFDYGSSLVARLSQCVYNSRHIDAQTAWLGE